MSLIPLGACGHTIAAANGTVTVATLTLDLPVGTLLLVRYSDDTESAATGPTSRHSIADSKVNSYTKVGEVTNSAGGWPAQGPALSAFFAILTTALSVGDTVTLTSTVTGGGRILSLSAFDPGGQDKSAVLVSAAGSHGESNAPAVTLEPPESGDYTWIGAGCHNNGQLTVTLDAEYTTDRTKLVANGGTHGNNTSHWGQYRSFEGGTDTFNAALSGSRKWVMLLAAFEVVDIIVVVPQDEVAGTVSGRPILADEPNWVTPIRQVLDPALAVADGAVGVWDAARLVENLPHGMAFQAHFTLFGREAISRWRAFLDRVAGRYRAFWCPGWTAVARLTADAAADQATLSVDPDHALEAGDWIALLKHDRTLIPAPILSADGGGATLTLASNLPVAVPQTPSRVSRLHLVRLADDEVALTFLAADIAELTLTVVAVHPDERDDADFDAPMSDPLLQFSERPAVLVPRALRRPTYSPGETFDLTWYRGSLWISGSSVVENYSLRITSPDACDRIEIQCADTMPVGFQPDEFEPGGPPFIWTVQPQSFDFAFGPGGSRVFSISITHGLGTMSPNCFRARVRQTFGDIVCYSPWRYWLALEEPIPVAPASEDSGRWTRICANMEGQWVLGPIPPGTFFPDESPPSGPSGTNCRLIEARWSQPSTYPFQYYNSYYFGGRKFFTLAFSDRHGLYQLPGASKSSSGFGGTAPFFPDTSHVNWDQYPLQIPAGLDD